MRRRARAAWRMAYHSAGRPRNPTSTWQQLIATHRDDAAREIAQVYAWRNEKDKAFEWLDRAYAQRDIGLAETEGRTAVPQPRSGTAGGRRS